MISKWKKYFREVLEIKTTPHEIALGFAVGTFIAILPTLGLGVFIGLLVILVYRKISKISMLVAFAIWNPIVLIPLASFSYLIGDLILFKTPVVEIELSFYEQIFHFTRRYIVGSFVVSSVISILSYFIIYYFSSKYKKEIRDVLQS